jgi:catechol 2,3-dioxygenase-like lactoylglutathione lyase family enzyme
MITGLHAIFYSPDADKVRAFLRDVLGLKSVDAGHGWLIFAARNWPLIQQKRMKSLIANFI